MAEKISMIIVQVDLDCHKCYKKICKILCQLQDCERIRTISFDNKNKTITIVGPFDPHRLAGKLRCKGGKVIRDIHIVDNNGGGKPPSSPPVKNGKQKRKEKSVFVEEKQPKAKPAELESSPMSPPRKEKPQKVKERSPPPLMPTRPCEHPLVRYVIPTVELCGCHCCAPCYYKGYYEGCRCYSCGRAYVPAPCGGYRGCRTFSDEDPTAACTVM